MINNSTLFFIIDDTNYRNEIIDINRLDGMEDECFAELDTLFRTVDYSPSDEVVKRILALI